MSIVPPPGRFLIKAGRANRGQQGTLPGFPDGNPGAYRRAGDLAPGSDRSSFAGIAGSRFPGPDGETDRGAIAWGDREQLDGCRLKVGALPFQADEFIGSDDGPPLG